MFIILGVLLWLIIGFCTYIWDIKRTHTTHFTWTDFLFTFCFGLISLIMIAGDEFVNNFPKIMENLIKKINK